MRGRLCPSGPLSPIQLRPVIRDWRSESQDKARLRHCQRSRGNAPPLLRTMYIQRGSTPRALLGSTSCRLIRFILHGHLPDAHGPVMNLPRHVPFRWNHCGATIGPTGISRSRDAAAVRVVCKLTFAKSRHLSRSCRESSYVESPAGTEHRSTCPSPRRSRRPSRRRCRRGPTLRPASPHRAPH